MCCLSTETFKPIPAVTPPKKMIYLKMGIICLLQQVSSRLCAAELSRHDLYEAFGGLHCKKKSTGSVQMSDGSVRSGQFKGKVH